jgi:hypothetical protein
MQGKKSGNSTRAGEGPKPGKSKSGKKAGRGKK